VIQSSIKADDLFLNLLLDPRGRRAGGFVRAAAPPIRRRRRGAAFTAKRTATPSERAAYAMATKAPNLLTAQYASRWSVWGATYGVRPPPRAMRWSDRRTPLRGLGRRRRRRLQGLAGHLLGFALAGGATSYSLANALGSGRSDLFQPAPSAGIISVGLCPARWPMAGTTSPPTARSHWPASTSCRAASGRDVFGPVRGRLSVCDTGDRHHALCRRAGDQLRLPDTPNRRWSAARCSR